MMNQEDHFYNINLPIDFVDALYFELKTVKWYNSSNGFCRSDTTIKTRNHIQQFLPFEIFCCGFFKFMPGNKQSIHKDRNRHASFNMLLCNESADYHVYTYTDDLTEKIIIPYHKNKPLLLNTKKFHSIHNASKEFTRIILTVGSTTDSYESIRDKFKQLEIRHVDT